MLYCYICHLPTEICLVIYHSLPRVIDSFKHPHLKSMKILTMHNKNTVREIIYVTTVSDISIARAQCDNDDPSVKQRQYFFSQYSAFISSLKDEIKTVKAYALAGDQRYTVGVLGMGTSLHLTI